MKYYKQLIGEKIYLSPPNTDDASLYCEWINDLEISINLNTEWSVNEEQEKELLRELLRGNNKVFGIIHGENDKLIGSVGFHDIDYINGGAQFGIFIGDKKYWDKGYGTEATQLILDFGFNILNLHNIYLFVYAYNKRAIKCYENIGFKIFGKRRNARLIGGKRYDIVFMDILRDEFTSPYVINIIEKS